MGSYIVWGGGKAPPPPQVDETLPAVTTMQSNCLLTEMTVLYCSDSVTHGQNFSHMIAQPTIINVQLEDEDERGIEVGHVIPM